MNGNTTNQTNFNNNNATNSPRTYNANAWVDRLATLIHQQQQNNNNDNNKKPLKLFIAGDRSQVGKTSICLGLLGALINSGYSPNVGCIDRCHFDELLGGAFVFPPTSLLLML
mgnify:CR=1 FL=1